MDQRQIDRLRAAGGRVGELSAVEWETLLDRHGTDVVAFATTRARLDHGRQVGPDEIGKHLPKVAPRPAAVAVAEEPEPPLAEEPAEAIVAPVAAEERAEAVAQVEAKPEPPEVPEAARFQRIPWRVFADLIRARPGISTRELSALLGRSVDAISAVLRNHAAKLRYEQSDGLTPRRWWLADGPAEPVRNPAPAQPVAPAVDESATTSTTVVQAEPEPPAPAKRKRYSKPSRALEPRVPTLLKQHHFDGDLLPLLEHVIDLWCLTHEIELMKPYRRSLRKACAQLCPEMP